MSNVTKLQLKRNKERSFDKDSMDDVYLADGEPFYDSATASLYIGDGKTPLSQLPSIGIEEISKLCQRINRDITSTINGNKIGGTVNSASNINSDGTSNVNVNKFNFQSGTLTALSSTGELNPDVAGTELPEISDVKNFEGRIFFKVVD